MGLRWVVCAISPDGDPHVYGPYRDKDAAEAFAARVNELVEKDEDAEQAEYDKELVAYRASGREGFPDGEAPLPRGRAVVRLLRPARIREARLYSSEGAMP